MTAMADDGEWVPVTELKFGDLVDLAGDRFADPGHGTPDHDDGCMYIYEAVQVGNEDGTTGELEEPGTFRLDHSSGACGFPPGHKLRRTGHADGI